MLVSGRLLVFAAMVPLAGVSLVRGAPIDTKVVRVPAHAAADLASLNIPADSIEDYGSFLWVELDRVQLDQLRKAKVTFTEEVGAFTLDLGGVRFDPAVAEPIVPSAWKSTRAAGTDFQLVQFRGPTRDEWLGAVAAAGYEVVQYIHPHTYVVWGDSGLRSSLDSVVGVRWSGAFEPAYRVLPRWRNLRASSTDFRMLVFRGADVDAALAAVTALGGRPGERHKVNDNLDMVGVTIPGDQLAAMATIPGIYTIQPVPTDGGLRGEMSNQVNVNNVDGGNLAFPGYQNWLNGVGLNGAGVIIANVDGGIFDTHPDLINRMLTCSGTTCGGSATDTHGTHTAGTMAADGSSGTTDSFGFLRGQGVAPGANLVEQVYSPFFTQPGGMLLLMTDSYNNGALLSGNSWGPAGSPRGYDIDTQAVDVGVRDADPNASGNQPLSYVLSFMNGNGGTSSQGTPDEAKNIFTIGSTKMQNSSGSQITDIDDISSNSAHGPALDGRTIPHMVAPGCYVDSTLTSTGYGTNCGTSMASPHVSGAIALFIEYYRNIVGSADDPSAALIKAAFIAVAKDLAGFRDADGGTLGHVFDSKQGWGRMDLEAVVDPALSVLYFDNPQLFDNTGEEWSMTLSALDTNEPVRLMLVWTDAPGHGLGGSTPAWNNDLDLIVEVGGDTYFGNEFGASGWSQTGGSVDDRNNTEGVFLGPTSPATFTVRVVASDINSDAIPASGDGTDQDFSLVCYNCVEEPGFGLTPAPPTVAVCAPNDAVATINVEQVLNFIEPVTLSAAGEPAGTTVSFTNNPLTPPDTSDMTVSNTGSASAGTYPMTVTGTATTVTRDTLVTLELYDAIPGTVLLSTPANGATEVSIPSPSFSWVPDAQAASYDWQISTDQAFGTLVESALGLPGTTYEPTVELDPSTLYYWRVRGNNPCGDGSFGTPFSFSTRAVPAILLVDDDDNGPDVRSFYTDTLDALGEGYDIWDTNNSDNEPDASYLSPYSLVIWFSGDEFGGTAGPGAAGEAALSTFLDAGNGLFISGQDYLWDKGTDNNTPNAFMQSYLGMSSPGQSDISQNTVTGAGTVYSGLGPYSLTYPFTNYSDRISPDGTAELGFAGDSGDAAISKDNGTYRTTYWGFPFEALPSGAAREEVMSAILAWMGTGGTVQAPALADSVSKNRYISYLTNNGTRNVAFEVTLAGSEYFPGDVGTSWWVGKPDANGVATLLSVPTFQSNWPAVVHVGDCEIVPAASYEIRTYNGVDFSDSLAVSTTARPAPEFWGDCVGPFDGSWPGPDGVVNFDDISAAVRLFQEIGVLPPVTWLDLHGDNTGNAMVDPPNYVVNFTDIQLITQAFQGDAYPYSAPGSCP